MKLMLSPKHFSIWFVSIKRTKWCLWVRSQSIGKYAQEVFWHMLGSSVCMFICIASHTQAAHQQVCVCVCVCLCVCVHDTCTETTLNKFVIHPVTVFWAQMHPQCVPLLCFSASTQSCCISFVFSDGTVHVVKLMTP